MEQLNKQQIILLALLVSFVSSIATGIVTVSLMEQDQPTATQTINRIVERTIERASDTPSGGSKETIIVREDQAVTESVAKVSKSLVRIYTSSQGSPSAFVGMGVVVSGSGRIVSSSIIPGGVPLVGKLQGGNVVSLVFIARNVEQGVSLLQADQSAIPAEARAYTAATLADSDKAKLGQSVVAVGGAVDPMAATGIISSIGTEGEVRLIKTSMNDQGFDSLAILANLLGEVVGIQSDNTAEKTFIPSNIIKTYATP